MNLMPPLSLNRSVVSVTRSVVDHSICNKGPSITAFQTAGLLPNTVNAGVGGLMLPADESPAVNGSGFGWRVPERPVCELTLASDNSVHAVTGNIRQHKTSNEGIESILYSLNSLLIHPVPAASVSFAGGSYGTVDRLFYYVKPVSKTPASKTLG